MRIIMLCGYSQLSIEHQAMLRRALLSIRVVYCEDTQQSTGVKALAIPNPNDPNGDYTPNMVMLQVHCSYKGHRTTYLNDYFFSNQSELDDHVKEVMPWYQFL